MDIDKLDIIVSVDTEGNNRLGNSLPTSIGIVVYDVKCMKFLTSFFVSLPPGEPDSNTLLWINDHKELFDASAKLVKPNVYVSDCAEHLILQKILKIEKYKFGLIIRVMILVGLIIF